MHFVAQRCVAWRPTSMPTHRFPAVVSMTSGMGAVDSCEPGTTQTPLFGGGSFRQPLRSKFSSPSSIVLANIELRSIRTLT